MRSRSPKRTRARSARYSSQARRDARRPLAAGLRARRRGPRKGHARISRRSSERRWISFLISSKRGISSEKRIDVGRHSHILLRGGELFRAAYRLGCLDKHLCCGRELAVCMPGHADDPGWNSIAELDDGDRLSARSTVSRGTSATPTPAATSACNGAVVVGRKTTSGSRPATRRRSSTSEVVRHVR